MSNDKRALIIVAIIGAVGAIIAAYIGIVPYLMQGPQLVTIQGKVTDENKMPVVGVTVGIDGLSDITGDEGKYCIRDVPAGVKTIRVERTKKEIYKSAFKLEEGKEIRIFDIPLTLQTHTATPTVTETAATIPSQTPLIMTPTPALTPTPTATYATIPPPIQTPIEWDTNYDGFADAWDTDSDGYIDMWDT